MTVSSELSRKSYAGDAVTTSHGTTPMVFFTAADLVLYVVTTATGVVVATLTLNTHYSVSGGSGAVGTISLAGGSSPYGAIPAGQTLVVVRDLALTQTADPVNGDSSDAEVIEAALDRGVMISQQLSASVDRSFKLADSDVSGASTELPTPEASTLIGWNDDGDALVNYLASDFDVDILVSSFMETVLDDEDGDAVVQTLVDSATALTAPAAGDIILLSDVSLTPDDGRKMTLANLFKVVNDLTAETAAATDDVLPLYDTDGATTDKITLANFFKIINVFTEDTAPDMAADYVMTYDASATAAKKVLLGRIGSVNGTAQLTTSGTAWTFTGIPSWAKRVTLMFNGLSFDNTAAIRVQIGPVAGVETSGYVGASSSCIATATAAVGTAGVDFLSLTSAAVYTGKIIFDLVNASTNTWSASVNVGTSNSGDAIVGCYSKPLAGALECLKLTTVAGTAAGDAGLVNIKYEG